ncbi:hypothetical protein [Tychonema sp. LEGE 07203]|uniref:hypothetical protein n=1 Tax=Tychonema sp. LEGE 07203 TaxID=1828671 RepID=UPI00188027F1|nr:hypothetical protein [Tychonema sp. LEGE 07203]MBE9097334.1 hypothetical protein [Tychonema sp. LEGE 07203]
MPAQTKIKAIATGAASQLNFDRRDAICQKSTASNNRLSYLLQWTLRMSLLCPEPLLLRQLYDREFDRCRLQRGFFCEKACYL